MDCAVRALHKQHLLGEPAADTNTYDAVLVQIAILPRHVLERLVQRAIDRLDEDDGDPDLEPGGDEADWTGAEDEAIGQAWMVHRNLGPGCPISDPDW